MKYLMSVGWVVVVVGCVAAWPAESRAEWGSTTAADVIVSEPTDLADSRGLNSDSGGSDSGGSDSGGSDSGGSDSGGSDSGGSDSGGSDSGGSDSGSDSNSGDSSQSDSGGSGDSSQSDSGQSSDSNSGDSSQSESGESSGSESGASATSDGGEPPDGDPNNNPNNTTDPDPTRTSASSSGGNSLFGISVLLTTVGATVGVITWMSWRVKGTAARHEALELYLRQNALAFESDASTGAGPAVDDLAAFFGIAPENQSRFGRVLRRLYPKLRPLLRDLRHDGDATARFVRLVVDAARDDAALENDLVRAGFLEPVLHVAAHTPSPQP